MAESGAIWPAYFLERGVSPTNTVPLGPLLAEQMALPLAVAEGLVDLYQPLAAYLTTRVPLDGAPPLIIGVNGAQGTGKSTAAQILKQLLQTSFGLRVAELSIDDLYLSRARREALGREVHPLLVTRGVPGTHNLALALDLFSRLKTPGSFSGVKLPRFNKAIDDCCPETQWDQMSVRPQVVLFEGWCVGARAQRAEDLTEPCNLLESSEDHKGDWRRYVNQQLLAYQELFAHLDMLIMLKAPSFDQVFEWRQLQEDKLRASLSAEQLASSRVMNNVELERFIAHYERLTRWMLREMPGRADVVIALDKYHKTENIDCHIAP